MIEPRVLKGFRDYLPKTMIDKKDLIFKLEQLFKMFGFDPIDTPALEYTEILLGKGSGETDKQIYRFNDHGGRDVSLRFDLTVPLARFVSLHKNELVFPFKRYHIAPVWRGENTQKGRYREFYQCDFDILGTTAPNSDLEILLLIKEGFALLNAGESIISVNHRMILNNLLTKLGIRDKSVDILRVLDKIYKAGVESVEKELVDIVQISSDLVDKILSFLKFDGLSNEFYEISGVGIFEALDKVESILGSDLSQPAMRMKEVFKNLEKLGYLSNFVYNPAITRGLDYYTGMVFETFISDRRGFGSVCSGGRYDNLTALYSKTPVPGIGGSFGLDRLIALMEDKGSLPGKSSNSEVIIFNLSDELTADYYSLASKLRDQGVSCEVSLESSKITNQFKYSEKKGVKYVIIAGENEIASKKYNLKDIVSGIEEKGLEINKIVETIKGLK